MQQAPSPAESDQRKVLEAIARRMMLAVDYNGARLSLAPHLLFERHGELFVGAHNPAKNRRSDEEPSLGYFKLKGLSNLEVSDVPFEPLENACDLPREDDLLVFAV